MMFFQAVFAVVVCFIADCQCQSQSQKCGQSGVIMPRLSGSFTAQEDDFPWLVRLVKDGNLSLNSGYYCSATIISDQWLITAAHCVEDLTQSPERLTGMTGVSFSNRADQPVISFGGIVLHPQFLNTSANKYIFYQFDYALLKTREKLVFNSSLSPVCLLSTCANEVPAKSLCIMAGWGSNRLGSYLGNYTVSEGLRKIMYPLVDQSTCQDSYQVSLADHMACFGFKENAYFDGCQGDIGAPMVCRNLVTHAYYLHGIDSSGKGCSLSDENYRVYSKPCSVIDWIKSVTNDNTVLQKSAIAPSSTTTPIESRTVTNRRRQIPPQKIMSLGIALPSSVPCGQLSGSSNSTLAPWVAVVAYGSAVVSGYLPRKCGATILSKRWLITSKTCLDSYNLTKPNSAQVFVGTNIRRELRYGAGWSITKQIDHPSRDVTILKTDGDLNLNQVAPVCLPKSSRISGNCSLNGWASSRSLNCSIIHSLNVNTRHPEKLKQAALHQGQQPVLFAARTLSYCKEDVGGPLACQNEDASAYSLQGVVTSYPTASNNASVLVEPICKLKNWINSETNNLSADESPDTSSLIIAGPTRRTGINPQSGLDDDQCIEGDK